MLDAQGFTICPECDTRINCGTAGLANLARHQGKGTCRAAKDKRDKDGKKKNMTILAFWKKPTAKPILIPSTVTHVKPIHNRILASAADPFIPTASAAPLKEKALKVPSKYMSEPVHGDLVNRLHDMIEKLPDTIPEATEYDKLAAFAGNPADHDDPSLNADELWEFTLNGILKSVFGWGTEGDMENIIRRGRKGLDGLSNFVRHFIVKRGVNEALFEGKLAHLLNKIEEMSVTSHFSVSELNKPL